MPIAIAGVAETGPGRPVAVVSAMVEFGSALHVLRDPEHHGATEWSVGTWRAMTPELVRRTRAWLWTAQAVRAVPLVSLEPPLDDVPSRVAALRVVPPRTLADQLLRPIGGAAVALHWSRSRGPKVAALVETLVRRPGHAVADFLDFLGQSWQEWYAATWAEREPVLAARARRFTDQVSRHGTVAALTGIDPAVTAAPGGVVVAKVQNRRHDVARRGLRVVPSTFIHPHLYVANAPGQPLTLIHPVESAPAAPPVADVLRRLEAVAHAGRLEVARAIATEPRTAGEISRLWGMDATLVNRHLRALAKAGLAIPVRRGRFVQYRLDVAAVEALGGELAALLLR